MTTPANMFALPLLHLRNGLVASTAFQTAMGAADAAAAAAFVHYFADEDADEQPLQAPFAVLSVTGPLGARQHAGGGRNEFVVEGQVTCSLTLSVTDSDSESDKALKACNTAGAIAADLLADAGEADRLDITSMEIGVPMRPEEKFKASFGDFVQIDFTINYRSFA